MSLWPSSFGVPARLFDQHFGHGLHPDDLVAPWVHHSPRYHSWGVRPHRQTGGTATVSFDKDKFQVCLDVQQFSPEEITVKTQGKQIVVEGKHEEKEDEHGYISRHFVRKYLLPDEHRPEDVQSSLSSDGVLTISAPRHHPALKDDERIVPIVSTGPAHTTVKKVNATSATKAQKMEQ